MSKEDNEEKMDGPERKMDIKVAKRAGFCFGVKRAVRIAFDMASTKEGVYTLGPIIHNPQVVKKLEEKGVYSVDAPSKEMKSVIIRTHGIPVDMYERISSMGIEAVDATCPFVKKAQEHAKLLKDEGYQVIILGDEDHPEVKSIMSFAGERAVVVRDAGDQDDLKRQVLGKTGRKVGVVVQTTQPVVALKRLLSLLVDQAREIKVHNTICSSTSLRQTETADICRQVDMMIVAGGKNSANTTQLSNLCKTAGVPYHHIETATELNPEWLDGVRRVGITAGASTPDWIINEIVERIHDIGG